MRIQVLKGLPSQGWEGERETFIYDESGEIGPPETLYVSDTNAAHFDILDELGVDEEYLTASRWDSPLYFGYTVPASRHVQLYNVGVELPTEASEALRSRFSASQRVSEEELDAFGEPYNEHHRSIWDAEWRWMSYGPMGTVKEVHVWPINPMDFEDDTHMNHYKDTTIGMGYIYEDGFIEGAYDNKELIAMIEEAAKNPLEPNFSEPEDEDDGEMWGPNEEMGYFGSVEGKCRMCGEPATITLEPSKIQVCERHKNDIWHQDNYWKELDEKPLKDKYWEEHHPTDEIGRQDNTTNSYPYYWSHTAKPGENFCWVCSKPVVGWAKVPRERDDMNDIVGLCEKHYRKWQEGTLNPKKLAAAENRMAWMIVDGIVYFGDDHFDIIRTQPWGTGDLKAKEFYKGGIAPAGFIVMYPQHDEMLYSDQLSEEERKNLVVNAYEARFGPLAGEPRIVRASLMDYKPVLEPSEPILNDPLRYRYEELTEAERAPWHQLSRDDKTWWKRKATSMRRRAERVGAPATIQGREMYALWNRYGGNCAYDGQPGADSWEHVIPLGQGGGSTVDNLLPVHENCNREMNEWDQRSAATIEEVSYDVHGYGNRDDYTRRPVVYNAETQMVYIGEPTSSHFELIYNVPQLMEKLDLTEEDKEGFGYDDDNILGYYAYDTAYGESFHYYDGAELSPELEAKVIEVLEGSNTVESYYLKKTVAHPDGTVEVPQYRTEQTDRYYTEHFQAAPWFIINGEPIVGDIGSTHYDILSTLPDTQFMSQTDARGRIWPDGYVEAVQSQLTPEQEEAIRTQFMLNKTAAGGYTRWMYDKGTDQLEWSDTKDHPWLAVRFSDSSNVVAGYYYPDVDDSIVPYSAFTPIEPQELERIKERIKSERSKVAAFDPNTFFSFVYDGVNKKLYCDGESFHYQLIDSHPELLELAESHQPQAWGTLSIAEHNEPGVKSGKIHWQSDQLEFLADEYDENGDEQEALDVNVDYVTRDAHEEVKEEAQAALSKMFKIQVFAKTANGNLQFVEAERSFFVGSFMYWNGTLYVTNGHHPDIVESITGMEVGESAEQYAEFMSNWDRLLADSESGLAQFGIVNPYDGGTRWSSGNFVTNEQTMSLKGEAEATIEAHKEEIMAWSRAKMEEQIAQRRSANNDWYRFLWSPTEGAHVWDQFGNMHFQEWEKMEAEGWYDIAAAGYVNEDGSVEISDGGTMAYYDAEGNFHEGQEFEDQEKLLADINKVHHVWVDRISKTAAPAPVIFGYDPEADELHTLPDDREHYELDLENKYTVYGWTNRADDVVWVYNNNFPEDAQIEGALEKLKELGYNTSQVHKTGGKSDPDYPVTLTPEEEAGYCPDAAYIKTKDGKMYVDELLNWNDEPVFENDAESYVESNHWRFGRHIDMMWHYNIEPDDIVDMGWIGGLGSSYGSMDEYRMWYENLKRRKKEDGIERESAITTYPPNSDYRYITLKDGRKLYEPMSGTTGHVEMIQELGIDPNDIVDVGGDPGDGKGERSTMEYWEDFYLPRLMGEEGKMVGFGKTAAGVQNVNGQPVVGMDVLEQWDGDGCFGWINGILYFGDRHHAAIIAALVEGGMDWDELLNAKQAWGWWVKTFDYNQEGDEDKPTGIELQFTSDDAQLSGKGAMDSARNAFKKVFQLPVKRIGEAYGVDPDEMGGRAREQYLDYQAKTAGAYLDCFGFVDGKLYIGDYHHADIIDRLVTTEGYEYEDLYEDALFGWLKHHHYPEAVEVKAIPVVINTDSDMSQNYALEEAAIKAISEKYGKPAHVSGPDTDWKIPTADGEGKEDTMTGWQWQSPIYEGGVT